MNFKKATKPFLLILCLSTTTWSLAYPENAHANPRPPSQPLVDQYQVSQETKAQDPLLNELDQLVTQYFINPDDDDTILSKAILKATSQNSIWGFDLIRLLNGRFDVNLQLDLSISDAAAVEVPSMLVTSWQATGGCMGVDDEKTFTERTDLLVAALIPARNQKEAESYGLNWTKLEEGKALLSKIARTCSYDIYTYDLTDGGDAIFKMALIGQHRDWPSKTPLEALLIGLGQDD